MNPISFEQATTADVLAIAMLHSNSWRENYKGIVSDDYLENQVEQNRIDTWQSRFDDPKSNQWVLLAKADNELVGFICLYGEHHSQHGTIIDNLHVDSNFKGRGIGTQLLIKGAEWAKEYYPQSAVYLEVLSKNSAAIGFYQSLGGKHIGNAIWNAPCGTKVEELLYQWGRPESLLMLSGKRT